MIILKYIFLVMSIPLASLYLSTILITDLLFIVSLLSCYISEIHGGLFQTTLSSQSSLIFLGGSFFIGEPNLLFFSIPIIIYSNADTDKLSILSENKNKAGIYQWIHKESGKIYIGSAVDLYKRLRQYYSISRLNRNKNQYISNALLSHGYSAFSLSILEYINIDNLSLEESKKLILEREQYYIDSLKPEYNILKMAGSSLGFSHSENSKALMSEVKSGENHPNYGKTHTVETKALMSLAMISMNRTGENHPFFGKTHSAETKALMSLTRSGENSAMYGRNHSAESKTKMSVAQGSTVFVYDTQDSLTYIFSSTRKAGEFFNCSPTTIKKYILTQQLFQGKWILSFIAKE